jgi:hypothetical protein
MGEVGETKDECHIQQNKYLFFKSAQKKKAKRKKEEAWPHHSDGPASLSGRGCAPVGRDVNGEAQPHT